MRKEAMILLCVLLALCVNTPEESEYTKAANADKVVVVHFHRIHQCTCCINVGKWAEETIQTYFADEYETGFLEYKDVCVEKNHEEAARYNAFGSSLYINVIQNGNDNISEIAEVWNHCHDHDAYIEVFKQILDDIVHG
ncbi:MAG: nitrophenyl compound nitroreductase subunit ArsF family protein [Candidatus Methanofastidiosia archaeon]|jgi:hypothetical protein